MKRLALASALSDRAAEDKVIVVAAWEFDTPSTKAAKSAFAELGLATAETSNVFFDANGQFVGMEEATRLLYDALAPLSDEQRLIAEETIFGSDASRAAEITFQAQKAAAAAADSPGPKGPTAP